MASGKKNNGKKGFSTDVKVLLGAAAAIIVIGVIGIITSAVKETEAASAAAAAKAQQEAEAAEAEAASAAAAEEAAAKLITGVDGLNVSHYADIDIEGYGTITVALDESAAPETVKNFVSLAKSGFYDGLKLHRIIDGFMMQGGDPLGNGTGGSDTTIKGEFSSNGVENNISHVRGAISMARAQDPDSASSQFFIVQSDSTFLDGEYAGFGFVTEGMDIVDQICKDAKPTDSNGTIADDAKPVINSITIRDAGDAAVESAVEPAAESAVEDAA